jgi:hypothetical protein
MPHPSTDHPAEEVTSLFEPPDDEVLPGSLTALAGDISQRAEARGWDDPAREDIKNLWGYILQLGWDMAHHLCPSCGQECTDFTDSDRWQGGYFRKHPVPAWAAKALPAAAALEALVALSGPYRSVMLSSSLVISAAPPKWSATARPAIGEGIYQGGEDPLRAIAAAYREARARGTPAEPIALEALLPPSG